jgi:hypothetical protein
VAFTIIQQGGASAQGGVILPNPIAAGHMILIMAATNLSFPPPGGEYASDNLGNNYPLIVKASAYGYYVSYIFGGTITNGGLATFNFYPGYPGGYWGIAILEVWFSGSYTVDATSGQQSTAGTQVLTSGFMTEPAANNLMVAAGYVSTGGQTWTAPTGQIFIYKTPSGTAGASFVSSYTLGFPPGSIQAEFDCTSGGWWSCCAAVLSGTSIAPSASMAMTERGDGFAGSVTHPATAATGGMVERKDPFLANAKVSPFLIGYERPDAFAGAAGPGVPPVGTMAVTEHGDSFVGAVHFTFDSRASLAVTERGDSFAGAVILATTATMALTEHSDSFLGAGAVAHDAVLHVTEAPDKFRGGPSDIAYNVYANTGAADAINYTVPLGTTYQTTFTTLPLSFPGSWMFAVRAHNSYGEEKNLDCKVTLILDATGRDITHRPMPPIALRGKPLAGGDIHLTWGYPPIQPANMPKGFNVYLWQKGSTPDLTKPAVVVAFSSGRGGVWTADLTGNTDATTYLALVRAYNAHAEENNQKTIEVTADASGPGPVLNLGAAPVA